MKTKYHVAITMVITIIFTAGQVFASSLCLTKQEARELWPKQHIYWYSKDHCWSNRRGPPRNIRIDVIKKTHAQVPTKQQVFDKKPAEKQDKIVDMDKWRAENCCWPDLPRDQWGNVIEPPPTFSERWNQIRDVFRSVWKELANTK